MPNNVTGANPGQIKPPSGLPTNPCGVDFAKLDQLDGLGKFSAESFFKSLLGFALGGMLPGPLSQIVNNQTIVPQEFPGIGALLGVASMLLETGSAAPNLQGLWGSVSGNCLSSSQDVAGSYAPDMEAFKAALANMPKAVVSESSMAAISSSFAAIKAGGDPLDPRIQAGLVVSCVPFQAGSDVIFRAYDAAAALKNRTNDLQTPLNSSARVHAAAKTALYTVNNIARFGVSQQLTTSGVAGRNLILNQINGAPNLSPGAMNMCGPDALKTLSILRQTCTAVDQFYGTSGYGSIDWESMTRNLGNEISAGAIEAVADEAAGLGAFTATEIMTGVNGTVDSFLARALCQGGSDNLADAASLEFGNAVGVALTATGAVATIYASASSMTQNFSNTLSVMQSFGSTSAINQMIGGNFTGLFGLASGKVSDPKLALLRSWQSCLAQRDGTDPVTLQILGSKINEEESVANVGWAMNIGQFDANGYFNKAKALVKSIQKVQDAILQNKPIQGGTTT